MKSFLQTPAWAKFKQTQGWEQFSVEGLSILGRKLPLGQYFLYAPEIPYTPIGLPILLTELRDLARAQGAFAVRLEFLHEWSAQTQGALSELGLVKAFEEIQPEFRQLIDLRPNTQAILAGMKQKGRYNIKIAEREGVVVEHAHDAAAFSALYRETAERDRFSGRADSYFASLVELLLTENTGSVWIARYQNTPLAGAIVYSYAGVTSYLYGASSSQHRERMAPYALHWAIMEEAKTRGDETYDLLAITPFAHDGYELTEDDYKLAQKYTGITRFKQQFGGRGVHLLGGWDLVVNPFLYQAFKAAQRIRRR